MGEVLRQGRGWKRVLRSGRQEPRRYSQDRMQRYLGCLVSGPRRSRKGVPRLRQRINRSIMVQFTHTTTWMATQRLTKIRIPSASFCQRSTILLSSSSAALEYMEKSGPELSAKLESRWLLRCPLRVVEVCICYRYL